MPPRCQLLPRSLSTSRLFLRSPDATRRSFTTPSALYQNALARRNGSDLGSHLPKHVIPRDASIPPYPYGPALLFKQSNGGLYGGQTIQFGNNVSPDTETKTRRHWKPNVLSKSLYSVALKKKIKLRVTAKVLKTIDREGGLDEYLLREDESRIKELGPMGWALRWRLMQTDTVVARFRAEAEALGLAKELINQQWPTLAQRARQRTKVQREQLEARIQQDPRVAENSHLQEEYDEYLSTEMEREEHILAWATARRNLELGLVSTVEEGVKWAFLRLDWTIREADGLYSCFVLETPREEAYLARANKKAAETEAPVEDVEESEEPEEPADEDEIRTSIKANAAKEIQDALEINDEDHQTALSKAQRAIEAGEFVDAESRSVLTFPRWLAAREEAHASQAEEVEEEDSWGRLMNTEPADSAARAHV